MIFPSDCKIAKLKPLFKEGSKTAPKNYRPISLLPLVSKIIEKVIHDQTQSFPDKNDTIYRYQSGFRKFFSTDSCLSDLKNKIATDFESGLYTDLYISTKTYNLHLFKNHLTMTSRSQQTPSPH